MWWDSSNTYTVTLASKSFRVLLAIIAYFNLEVDQLDVVSAFLNSSMDEKVYIRHPAGFFKYGWCLLLLCALYGLLKSLKL